MSARLFVASDHAGFALKEALKKRFPSLPWADLGPASDARVDYPDFADLLASEMKKASKDAAAGEARARAYRSSPDSALQETVGLLICGSGQGMSIRANRHPHLRAALCFTAEASALGRAHNDANVLCLGSRFTTEDDAAKCLQAFLDSPFEGGRHAARVDKLAKPC